MDTAIVAQEGTGEIPNDISRVFEIKEVPIGTKLDTSAPSILLFQGKVIIIGKKGFKVDNKDSTPKN